MGDLNPTKLRLDVMAAIGRGEVFTYEWSEQYWQQRIGMYPVSRQARELLTAGYATEPAAAVDGARVWLKSTDAGREWLHINTPRSTR